MTITTTWFYSSATTNVYTRSLVYNLTLKQIIGLGFSKVPLAIRHTNKFYF